MPGRSHAGGLPKNLDAALEVGRELAAAHPQLEAVAVAMKSDQVPGRRDPRRQFRAPPHLLPDQEEDRVHRLALQDLEDRRGAFRMRTVVEGQGHAIRCGERPLEPQRGGGAPIDRGQEPERDRRRMRSLAGTG